MGSTSLSGILRIVLGSLGAILFLVGLALAVQGGDLAASAFWPIVLGIGLVIVALYEQGRYRAGQDGSSSSPGMGQGTLDRAGQGGTAGSDRPPSHFERTEEVFTDPSSGQLTRVWYDATTGRREYRPER